VVRRGGHAGRPGRAVRGLRGHRALAISAGLLVSVWTAYVLWSARRFDSPAASVAPYLYVPLLLLLGVWVGGLLSRSVTPKLLGLCLAIVGVWMILGVALTPLPGKAPIGYTNANAALGIQLLALSTLNLLRDRRQWWSWMAVGASLVAVLANASRAGTALAVALAFVGGLALLLPRARRRWPAALTALLMIAAMAVGVSVIARRVHWADAIDEAVNPVRRALWNTAWEAFRGAEAIGSGPGSFAAVNPRAGDPDTMSAHSALLQTAAELGLTGLCLLAVATLLALVAAGRIRPANASWIVATAITLLVVHAGIDHILEWWPVSLVCGLVLGHGLAAEAHTEAENETV